MDDINNNSNEPVIETESIPEAPKAEPEAPKAEPEAPKAAPEYTYTANTAAPKAEPAPAKSSRGKGTVALVLCCSLLSACVGAGGALWVNNSCSSKNVEPAEAIAQQDTGAIANAFVSSRQTSILNTVGIENDKLLTTAEVYKANVGSTVGITTEITTTNLWGYTSQSAASGSGFIITDNGYILTNYHVIEDANKVTVSFYDGTAAQASIVGYDESNDIAVLKVDKEGLTPVLLGDSSTLSVGDTVVAIGNPLGELTFSLTAGVVSALDREITLSSSQTMNLIQTDCAINSGNSGGALFNMYGEVIGITNAKYSGNSGSGASIDNIGFAIPINSVMNLVNQLIEKGYITYPYIGVSVTTVGTESKSFGIPAGAAVAQVVEDAPAAKAGIAVNDIITALDGEAVESSSELVTLVGKTQPGEEHVFTVYRQGETLDITITIGERTSTTTQTQSETQSQTEQQQSQSGSGNSIEDFFNNFPGSGYGSYGGGYGNYGGGYSGRN